MAASTSLTATVSIKDPVGRDMSSAGGGEPSAEGCGDGGGNGCPLHGRHEDLVDGELGCWLLRLGLEAAILQVDENSDAVAGGDPAADNALRLELERDFLQPLRDLPQTRWP